MHLFIRTPCINFRH